MKKNFLDSFDKNNPYLWISAKEQLTPDEIKAFIIEVLGPYIEDKEYLMRNATGVLAVEAANIAKILSRPDWNELFETTLETYYQAESKNSNLLFKTIAMMEKELDKGLADFTAQVNFEVEKKDLDLEELRFECFRNIGLLTESPLQTYLREFLCVLRLAEGNNELNHINEMSLGAIVSEIESKIANKSLVSPEPWNLKISEWRNIAQHFDSKVDGKFIVCKYGKNRSKIVKLTQTDVLNLTKEVMRRLSIFKGAREIFIFNNMKELEKHVEKKESDTSTKFFYLASAFSTQGFKTIHTDYSDRQVTFGLRDMFPNLGTNREMHCAQFLLSIYNFFPDKDIVVIYHDPSKNIETVFSADKTGLRKVLESEEPWDLYRQILRAYKRPATLNS